LPPHTPQPVRGRAPSPHAPLPHLPRSDRHSWRSARCPNGWVPPLASRPVAARLRKRTPRKVREPLLSAARAPRGPRTPGRADRAPPLPAPFLGLPARGSRRAIALTARSGAARRLPPPRSVVAADARSRTNVSAVLWPHRARSDASTVTLRARLSRRRRRRAKLTSHTPHRGHRGFFQCRCTHCHVKRSPQLQHAKPRSAQPPSFIGPPPTHTRLLWYPWDAREKNTLCQ
jgi:hypothetical protein